LGKSAGQRANTLAGDSEKELHHRLIAKKGAPTAYTKQTPNKQTNKQTNKRKKKRKKTIKLTKRCTQTGASYPLAMRCAVSHAQEQATLIMRCAVSQAQEQATLTMRCG
jgi:hypothetical protein